jgi:hypothetical protein
LSLGLLTASRLRAARACQRLHYFEYEVGVRVLNEAETLRFGTLIHKGLEAWWKDDGSDRLGAALRALAECESDPFELVKAQELIRGYHLRWQYEPYKVLGVELEFVTELRNPTTGGVSRTWRLAGKLDVLVQHLVTKEVFVIEHKTTSEDITAGSEYWKRLRMDGQVSCYFLGGASLGWPIAGCIYDVIGKPALRPSQVPELDADGVKQVLDGSGQRVRTKDGKKWRETGDAAQGYTLKTRHETVEEFRERVVEAIASAPDRYYQRGEVVRLEAEMGEALFDIWQLGQQIREGQLAKRHPRNPDACVRYGRTCPYFDVCTGTASLEDETRFRRIPTIHPELQGATP